MVFLMVMMGLINLGLGLVLAMYLGFGPPNVTGMLEAMGPIPRANEIGESADTSANDAADPSWGQSDGRSSDLGAANASSNAASSAANGVAANGGPSNGSVANGEVDSDEDLANNPFLEQSVYDEVRALEATLATTGAAAK